MMTTDDGSSNRGRIYDQTILIMKLDDDGSSHLIDFLFLWKIYIVQIIS